MCCNRFSRAYGTLPQAQDYQDSVDSNKQMSEIERFEKKQQAREVLAAVVLVRILIFV